MVLMNTMQVELLAIDKKFHFHSEVNCPNIAVFSFISFKMERMDSMHEPGNAQRWTILIALS